MKELLLLPVASMTIYLLYVYFSHGMTHSISATYRFVKGFGKMWFSVNLWAVAIPIIIVGIENTKSDVPVLWFLSGALLCLVAASPEYWSGKHELTAHLVGSYGSIGLGMTACVVYLPSLVTFLIIGAFIFFALSQLIDDLQIKNRIYWVEVTALVAVCAVLYLN